MGGIISSEHFQQAEWKRVFEWMRRPTMHAALAWITELSNVVVSWQRWGKVAGPFGTNFRTTELAKESLSRIREARQVESDPWNPHQFPRAAMLKAKIQDPTLVEKVEHQATSAAHTFELETRFWMQANVRLPTMFWLCTDSEVGPYFLAKVLAIVQPSWRLELPRRPPWAASAAQQAEIDNVLTPEWHSTVLQGLKQLALAKSQKNTGLIDAYDCKAELKAFWTKHQLGTTELKPQWLRIARGQLDYTMDGFDHGCGVDGVFQVALRHGIVHPHRNGKTEACMNMLLRYGNKRLELLRQERKFQIIGCILEPQRLARRRSQLRRAGTMRDAGKMLVVDLGNKAQQRMYLTQLLELANSFTSEELAGAQHRSNTRNLRWQKQEQQLRVDRLPEAEHVVEKIVDHCDHCVAGHGDIDGNHADRLYQVRWRHYEDLVWETQDDLLEGWAAAPHHLELLQGYHVEHGLEEMDDLEMERPGEEVEYEDASESPLQSDEDEEDEEDIDSESE